MGKSELFSHFAERFEVKRTQAREFFDALTELAEKELKEVLGHTPREVVGGVLLGLVVAYAVVRVL